MPSPTQDSGGIPASPEIDIFRQQVSGVAGRVSWRSRAWRRNLEGYLFALPWFIGFFGLILGPMLASLAISFTTYDIVNPPRWAGLANFRRLFGDPLFWTSLGNTVYYVGFSVPSSIALAVALAMLLNRPLRGIGIFRTIFYLPSITSSVAVALLWVWLFDPQIGLIDAALRLLGLPAPLWLGSTTWSKPALILMHLWSIGNSIVLFLAGLQGIPAELYEAAIVDGASPWRSFWAITIPMLSPTLFFVFVISVIGAAQVFTEAFVMTQGGPLNSTYFLVLYLYNSGFTYLRMGYAAAMSWVMFILLLCFTFLQFRLARRWVYYESGEVR